MSLRIVLVVAQLTLREVARRKVLWVLGLLSVSSVALVGWGVDRMVAEARRAEVNAYQLEVAVSQVLILIAFMFSFVLAMSAAFLAAPAIASDVETGTVLALLARPVSRADLVVGRWLGLAVVVAGYAVLSGLLAVGVVRLVSGYAPPATAVALAFLALQAITPMTAALALGTRLPGIAAGAVTVVLFGLAWFMGVLAALSGALGIDALAGAGEAMRLAFPTDGLWRGVVYGLEPPQVVSLMQMAGMADAPNPFFADQPPPAPYVAWCVAWIALALGAGAWLFGRREL